MTAPSRAPLTQVSDSVSDAQVRRAGRQLIFALYGALRAVKLYPVENAAVQKALAELPERQRRIVELRYGFAGETTSLEAIGKELGLTRERVRRLERDALDRLQRELRGVVSASDLANAA